MEVWEQFSVLSSDAPVLKMDCSGMSSGVVNLYRPKLEDVQAYVSNRGQCESVFAQRVVQESFERMPLVCMVCACVKRIMCTYACVL